MPRHLLGALIACLAAGSLSAQPHHINWQALLTDTEGAPLAGPVNLEFNFYYEALEGTSVWTVIETDVALDAGMADVRIGPLTASAYSVHVDFSKPVWLGVRVNGATELAPRTPVNAVPVATTLAAPALVQGNTADPGAILRALNTEGGRAIEGDAPIGVGVWGVGASGVRGEAHGNQNYEGYGVEGIHYGDSGETVGVKGHVVSPDGVGVLGQNHASTGLAVGVLGQTASATGTGIRGEATALSGQNRGVVGVSSSTVGFGGYFEGSTGVYGTGTTGVQGVGTIGVHGMSPSTAPGNGVSGFAFSQTGDAHGVYGQTLSATGRGVKGVAANEGDNAGVEGVSHSTAGHGIIGRAVAPWGTTFGVYGETTSADGYAGYFSGGRGVYSDAGLEVRFPNTCTDSSCNVPGVHVVARGSGNANAALRAVNQNAGGGVGAYLRTDGTGSPLALAQYGSGDVMWAWVNGRGTVFSVSNEGNIIAAGTVTSSGADLAESFAVEGAIAAYQPGDVLSISTSGSRLLTLSKEPYSSRVAGVYATKPGVLLSDVPRGSSVDRVPLGVVGVIPTKVSGENGPIQPGDLLTTSSTPGHAMRADPARVTIGAVLGKALEPFEGPGTGRIEVLVNVK